MIVLILKLTTRCSSFPQAFMRGKDGLASSRNRTALLTFFGESNAKTFVCFKHKIRENAIPSGKLLTCDLVRRCVTCDLRFFTRPANVFAPFASVTPRRNMHFQDRIVYMNVSIRSIIISVYMASFIMNRQCA